MGQGDRLEREKWVEREKRLLSRMIALYCRAHHGRLDLCDDCAALEAYAHQRSEHCPRMDSKDFCSNCPHPCYRPQEREAIRRVMRYAGPRMLFYHPVLLIRHVFHTKRKGKQTEVNA
ncbi:MAG: nitrous oxide-stimulated promoter family protein [Bacillota bacterium]|nr:nitrous oxide-stimulated promoter family protein [Bacillota bacterium]